MWTAAAFAAEALGNTIPNIEKPVHGLTAHVFIFLNSFNT